METEINTDSINDIAEENMNRIVLAHIENMGISEYDNNLINSKRV